MQIQIQMEIPIRKNGELGSHIERDFAAARQPLLINDFTKNLPIFSHDHNNRCIL